MKKTHTHTSQERILEMAQEGALKNKTLGEMAEITNIKSGPLVKHHINKLQQKGFVRYDKSTKSVLPLEQNSGGFLSIPIYGAANAGPAAILANQDIQGYIRISKKVIKKENGSKLFALKVDGDSMNNEFMNGHPIKSGNLVIVEKGAEINDQDIVVSFFSDNTVNIKKFKKEDDYISLISNSKAKRQYPPIIISNADEAGVNGKVIFNIAK